MNKIGPRLFKKPFVQGFMHEWLLTPILAPLFLGASAFAENWDPKEGWVNLRDKTLPVLATALPYWSIVNSFIYMKVPFHLRIST